METIEQILEGIREYEVMGAIAGKVFSKDLQNRALKKGFVVLTQQGNHIEQIIPSKI